MVCGSRRIAFLYSLLINLDLNLYNHTLFVVIHDTPVLGSYHVPISSSAQIPKLQCKLQPRNATLPGACEEDIKVVSAHSCVYIEDAPMFAMPLTFLETSTSM